MPVAWNIIRGELTNFGAGEDQLTVGFGETIDDAADCFVRLTNVGKISAGIAAGSSGTHFNDDLTCSCHTITTTGFDLERSSTGYNTDVAVAWEAWLGDFTVVDYREHTISGTTARLRLPASPT